MKTADIQRNSELLVSNSVAAPCRTAASRSVCASDVNCFLRLGYFLNYRNPFHTLTLSRVNRSQYLDVGVEELVTTGVDKYRRAVERQFEANRQHVVPLSGGLDSRGILSALIEHTDARNILTYTFGTPGTYDFEIGRLVADAAGIRHVQVPLTNYSYTTEKLVSIARRVDFQTCLFHHPDVEFVDKLCEGKCVWSGAIIDVFFGRHEHQTRASDWGEAKRNFIRENDFVKGVNLANSSADELFHYIDCEDGVGDWIALEHILDLLNRQLKFIAPHVLMKGYDYRVLFKDSELVEFCLALDESFLRSQILYKRILLRAFPALFRIRRKSSDGLSPALSWWDRGWQRSVRALRRALPRCWRVESRVNPMVNYIDFAAGLRERDDLRNVVWSCTEDLKRRGIVSWINIDQLRNQHLCGEGDYARALLVLASLELHLKAGLRYAG